MTKIVKWHTYNCSFLLTPPIFSLFFRFCIYLLLFFVQHFIYFFFARSFTLILLFYFFIMFLIFFVSYSPFNSFLFHFLLHFKILLFFKFALILFISSNICFLWFLIVSSFRTHPMLFIRLKRKGKFKFTFRSASTHLSNPWWLHGLFIWYFSYLFLCETFLIKSFFLNRLHIYIVTLILWLLITFHFYKECFI